MSLRRMPLVLALAAVLIFAALGWLVPLSRNSQAAPAPSSDAAFKGKVVLANSGNMSLYLLEKAQLQKIGDRLYLVGKGAAEGQKIGGHKGRTVWVNMDAIESITAYDNLDDARKAAHPDE